MLLAGDSGTGKSTIVDAVEFCLQATAGRLASGNDPDLPAVVPVAARFHPAVSATFADGAAMTRLASIEPDGRLAAVDPTPHNGFDCVPVSIKRADILRFPQESVDRRLRRLWQCANRAGPNVTPVQPALMGGPIERVRKLATSGFRKIAPNTSITEVLLVPQLEDRLPTWGVEVRLVDGRTHLASRVLSEGKQDLLTLLLLMAATKEAAQSFRQRKLLVLDDVFLGISGEARVHVAEYLKEQFRGWQLVITVSDRLWASQLYRILDCPLRYQIRSWSPAAGPVVGGQLQTLREALGVAMGNAAPDVICALSGRLLEELSDQLSVEHRTSVKRNKRDLYTLEDTWSQVSKELKPTLPDIVAAVNRWRPLRNLVGAHYNEWAQSLTLGEARAFAHSVLDLDGAVSGKEGNVP